jgi:hypothetical protein
MFYTNIRSLSSAEPGAAIEGASRRECGSPIVVGRRTQEPDAQTLPILGAAGEEYRAGSAGPEGRPV